MKVSIIGTGLIGGSLAMALKENGFASHVTGVDSNEQNINTALELQLIDEAAELPAAVKSADLIILAIPVNAIQFALPEVLNMMNNGQTVMDMGSTKQLICESVEHHPLRSRFVATHPMWGTEKSGPEAAVHGAFTGRTVVFCEKQKSAPDALQTVKRLYDSIGMTETEMDAKAHDMHVAYVSHVSHLASYALALTVLEKEKEEDAIFLLASGGFESTVRLAKSPASMWVPIFQQNRNYVLDVLNEHIHQLKQLKKMIEMEEYDTLEKLIKQANDIERILK
ncbi:MAG: prephenate dehydrogenase [Chitinophagaceae bacterium]|nr:prephenate dehydrogenase [Chitinophagaceae bacterium]